MKTIKTLVCYIKEELHDAEKYYIAARLTDDTALRDTYRWLAEQELEHVDKLHDSVVRIIKKYRETNGDPPATMQAIWDYEHEEIIKDTDKLKAQIEEL